MKDCGMKKGAAIAAALACAAAAAQNSTFVKYQDWQLMPVTVTDTNAGDNVRLQTDFTKPLHGPWIFNPTTTSMSVNWITRLNCAGGIDYREKGSTNAFTRVWQSSCGLPSYLADMHLFHLSGLKPGTEYEYRLLSGLSTYDTPYPGTVVGREIYTFRTMDPDLEEYSVYVTSDVHGSYRLCLDPQYEAAHAEDCSLYFLLGDNVEDSMTDARYYITFGYLDDICRLWGANKPTAFLRGNHDCWGREAILWADYFGRPDNKAYYTISQGPALFILFDPPRDRTRSESASQVTEAYMRGQAAWLAALKETPEWRNATFRIGMCHYGTRVGGPDYAWFARYFKDLLNDTSPEGRIHLFLAGHEHHYARNNPRTMDFASLAPFRSKTPLSPEENVARARKLCSAMTTNDFNFCEVSCHSGEAMTIHISKDKLSVKSVDWHKPGGVLFDAFEIAPDGSVTEIPH